MGSESVTKFTLYLESQSHKDKGTKTVAESRVEAGGQGTGARTWVVSDRDDCPLLQGHKDKWTGAGTGTWVVSDIDVTLNL